MTKLNKFEPQGNFLYRHLDEADFCGRGPDFINQEDLNQILDNTAKYFFARKFQTKNYTEEMRLKVQFFYVTIMVYSLTIGPK